MARKPKSPAAPPAAAPAALAETVVGLQVVTEMCRDLLDDAMKEAQAIPETDTATQQEAVDVVGPILQATQALTRACVAAGILPAEILDEIKEEVVPTEPAG